MSCLWFMLAESPIHTNSCEFFQKAPSHLNFAAHWCLWHSVSEFLNTASASCYCDFILWFVLFYFLNCIGINWYYSLFEILDYDWRYHSGDKKVTKWANWFISRIETIENSHNSHQILSKIILGGRFSFFTCIINN